MKGDCYIGRGSKQQGLTRSVFANPHKVSVHGRERAVRMCADTLVRDTSLQSRVLSLSGCQLVCHCTPAHECHDGVSSQTLTTATPLSHDPPQFSRTEPARPSPVKSQTRLRVRLQTKALHPRQRGWRGAGPATGCRSGVHVPGALRRPRPWRRPEGGHPRTGSIQSHPSGAQRLSC